MTALAALLPLPFYAAAETGSAGGASEPLMIEGVYVGPGVECPLFELDNGRQVTLSGQVPELESGARFKLTGRWARISNCMQGATFNVTDSDKVKDAP